MPTRASHAVLLIEQLNKLNNKAVDPSGIDVGSPQPNTTDKPGETMVVLTAKATNTKYYGSQTATYDRFDLGELFATIGVSELEIDGHDIANTHELIVLLADKYQWDIGPDDVVNTPIDLEDSDTDILDLQATEDSLLYRGKIELTA